MRKVYLISALSFATVLLVGCGDDSGTSVNENNNGSELVEYSSSNSDIKAQSSNGDENFLSSSNNNVESSSSSENVVNLSSSFGEFSCSNNVVTSSSSSSLAELKKSSSSVVTRAGDVLVDSRDGETYKTVYIGDQHWMAENLRYRAVESDTSTAGKKGRYYSWAVAMDTAETPCNYGLCEFERVQRQGVCPDGWHIPSYEEWRIFLDDVEALSSNPLEVITDDKESWDYPGNNLTGFTAIPAGMTFNGDFYRKSQALIWSSNGEITPKGDSAFARYLRITDKNGPRIESLQKYVNMSVRCIENSEVSEKLDYLNHKEYSGPYGELTDPRDGKKYKTVVLNNIEWMAENLNFETPASVCGGAADSCAKYGRLYSDAEYKTVCPEGWRIPKDSDVLNLIPFNGYKYVIGYEMKSTSGWVEKNGGEYGYNANGSNALGLNILPQGFYSDSTSYMGLHKNSAFRVERAREGNYAFAMEANKKEGWFGKSEGFYAPVRCVKD